MRAWHIYGGEYCRGDLSVGELAPHLWPLPALLMETHKNVSHYSEKDLVIWQVWS